MPGNLGHHPTYSDWKVASKDSSQRPSSFTHPTHGHISRQMKTDGKGWMYYKPGHKNGQDIGKEFNSTEDAIHHAEKLYGPSEQFDEAIKPKYDWQVDDDEEDDNGTSFNQRKKEALDKADRDKIRRSQMIKRQKGIKEDKSDGWKFNFDGHSTSSGRIEHPKYGTIHKRPTPGFDDAARNDYVHTDNQGYSTHVKPFDSIEAAKAHAKARHQAIRVPGPMTHRDKKVRENLKPSDKILQLNKILTESPGCWKENGPEASGIVKLRDEEVEEAKIGQIRSYPTEKDEWDRLTPKPKDAANNGIVSVPVPGGGKAYIHKDKNGKATHRGLFTNIEAAQRHAAKHAANENASIPGFSVNKRS